MSSTQSGRHIHFERLHHPPPQPWPKRVFAHTVCHVLVRSVLLGSAFFRWLRGSAGKHPSGRPARAVLTGTFFADNWIEAHVKPLALSPRCEHVWVVADRPFVPLAKVSYVCAPRWLQELIGRVPARSLVFVMVSFRHRPNIVAGFHLLFNGLLALVVARMVGARAMYFCVGGWAEFVNGGVHGGNHIFNLISRKDPVLERLLLCAIKQMDLILTMGTGARDVFRSFGVDTAIEVMSGGIDHELYAQQDHEKRYDLIAVSRIVPVKRLDVLLEVVKRVAEKVPSVTAVVVGDGDDLDALVEQSERMGLTKNVSFVGRKNNVHRWLKDARIYVLTSDSEGLALALMEGMMAGLPAVVTDVGDLGDLVENGVNGYRLSPGDVERLAARIVDLLTDDELYRRCATEARAAAMSYTVEAMRDRWDAIMEGWQLTDAVSDPSKTRPPRMLRSRKQVWESSTWMTRHSVARMFSVVKPHVWLGKRFRAKLRFVSAAQHWSRDEAAAYQLRALQKIVTLANDRSPYYRKQFRACGFEPGDLRGLEDIAKLPTIDAQTIRDHLPLMRTRQFVDPNADYISTGGTSGSPLRFHINADRSAIEFAYLVAGWQRAGYSLETPLAVFRGRVVSENLDGLHHDYDPFLRHHRYSGFHMSDASMRDYVEHLAGIGPCYLHVYPSAVAVLARFLKRSGIKPPENIRGIIAESEIVYPEQRRRVEELFGCRYFSCYGHTEKVAAAAECEQSTDYHVWPTYGYFELLDENGRLVTTPGKRGEIVGTGFINTVVPFIRYRTGDLATFVGDRCDACGRQHTIITDIRGHRTQEMLVANDGSLISWTALNMHDDTFDNVRQFQFRQDTPGAVDLRIVPGASFTDDDRQRILANLNAKLTGRVHVNLQMTDAIKLSTHGKAVYVDQKLHVPELGDPNGEPGSRPLAKLSAP